MYRREASFEGEGLSNSSHGSSLQHGLVLDLPTTETSLFDRHGGISAINIRDCI